MTAGYCFLYLKRSLQHERVKMHVEEKFVMFPSDQTIEMMIDFP